MASESCCNTAAAGQTRENAGFQNPDQAENIFKRKMDIENIYYSRDAVKAGKVRFDELGCDILDFIFHALWDCSIRSDEGGHS